MFFHFHSPMIMPGLVERGRTIRGELQIAVCGLDRAGKTTMLEFVEFGDQILTVPTVGFDTRRLELTKQTLSVFDLAGQQAYREGWKDFIQYSDVMIYVIDSVDKARFDESKKEFLRTLEYIANETIIIILANKQDVRGAASSDEIFEYFELEKVDKELFICETSALTGEGLREAFMYIIDSKSDKILDSEFPEQKPKLECFNDKKFKCIWLDLGKCIDPENIDCEKCERGTCINCANSEPSCFTL